MLLHAHQNTRIIILFFAIFFSGCSDSSNDSSKASPNYEKKTLEVLATAYTSHLSETTKEGGPFKAAWGDTLEPGIKAIAVSRDLIPLGLTHKRKVKIEGLEGEYVVLDKMNKRWTQKIDIYFGMAKKAAREWGKRRVTITWYVPKEE